MSIFDLDVRAVTNSMRTITNASLIARPPTLGWKCAPEAMLRQLRSEGGVYYFAATPSKNAAQIKLGAQRLEIVIGQTPHFVMINANENVLPNHHLFFLVASQRFVHTHRIVDDGAATLLSIAEGFDFARDAIKGPSPNFLQKRYNLVIPRL